MKWIFLIVLFLLCAAGAEFWALRERAEDVCHSAHELARATSYCRRRPEGKVSL